MADLVIFDEMKIMDRATYIDPYKYPVGIRYMVVNGKIVINKGTYTKALSGMVLRINFSADSIDHTVRLVMPCFSTVTIWVQRPKCFSTRFRSPT